MYCLTVAETEDVEVLDLFVLICLKTIIGRSGNPLMSLNGEHIPAPLVWDSDRLQTLMQVIFMCNHCPYVIHLKDAIKELTDEYIRVSKSFREIISCVAIPYQQRVLCQFTCSIVHLRGKSSKSRTLCEVDLHLVIFVFEGCCCDLRDCTTMSQHLLSAHAVLNQLLASSLQKGLSVVAISSNSVKTHPQV
jgi:hypothetical protein